MEINVPDTEAGGRHTNNRKARLLASKGRICMGDSGGAAHKKKVGAPPVLGVDAGTYRRLIYVRMKE